MKRTLYTIIALLIFSVSVNGQIAPVADFSCDTISTNPCCIAFTNLSTNSPSGSCWYFGDGMSSTATNPTYCFMVPGIYFVTLIVWNGLLSDTIIKVVNTTTCDCDSTITGQPSIEKEKLKINIYPNPFSTLATLRTDNLFKNVTLTVYNLYGQTVKQIKNISGQTITLQRDNLPSGLYLMRLSQENKIIATRKLVISD